MDWLAQDRRHLWHPFTQEKTAPPPLLVQRAKGAYLYTDDGAVLFDAISSWWVNLHGHCHPDIVAAVTRQLGIMEQVIFAGVTHDRAVELACRVLALWPNLSRVFYSDNGSTAVEVALKMALQYWANRREPRRKLLALRHGYHGDTFGAMAVSERSVFNQAFWPLLFQVVYVDAPSRKQSKMEAEAVQHGLERALAEHQGEIAAFIYEPMIQGAGGMLMQDAQAMSALLARIQEEGILCIADEVMTGFGRSGKLFASEYLAPQPDIVCLAKGLTGGTIPLSMTLCHERVYEAFLADDRSKAFFHGHSFTANSLGCAAALASLDLLASPACLAAIERIRQQHRSFRQRLLCSELRLAFRDIRQQGTILACELESGDAGGYFSAMRDEMAAFFLAEGVLLRPLGNTVYVLPPYCSEENDLNRAYGAIERFAARLLSRSNG